MKRTFKLSIVLLCILMLFASCNPATKAPDDINPADHIEGTVNADETITMPAKGDNPGIVVTKDGYFAGTVEKPSNPSDHSVNERPIVKNPDGTVLKYVEDEKKIENVNNLTLKIMTLIMGEDGPHKDFGDALVVDRENYNMDLKREVKVDGLTFHAIKITSDETGDAFNAFMSFTDTEKHTVTLTNEALFLDGELYYMPL